MTAEPEHDESAAPDRPGPPAATPGPGGRKKRRRRPLILVGAGVVALMFLLGVLLVTTHSSYYIPSRSMVPTLEPGDRILVDDGTRPSRGDIVVVHNPNGSASDRVPTIVKRVIGLPGETVVIEDDQVSIDGHLLAEPYLEEGMVTQPVGPHGCPPSDPCVIPDGDVWLMGDNRTDSQDSRYFGPVAQSTIVGRVDFLYWPLSRAGSL